MTYKDMTEPLHRAALEASEWATFTASGRVASIGMRKPRAPETVAKDVLTAALQRDELAEFFLKHRPRPWTSGDITCACDEWETSRDVEGWKLSTHEYAKTVQRAHAEHVSDALHVFIFGPEETA
jgi:hypothetical protein